MLFNQLTSSKDSQSMRFLVSFIRRPFLWPCGRRQSFVTKLALGAKFAKNTKLTTAHFITSKIAVFDTDNAALGGYEMASKNSLRNLRNQRQKIRVNPCSSVVNFLILRNTRYGSIKTTKLCKTNPISEKVK